MADPLPPLSVECLLNAFYVIGAYLIACPQIQLHLAPTYVVPSDLRVHDYSQRYHLDLTCLIQLVRTVYAAQHAAHHYHTWSIKQSSSDMRLFAREAFGVAYDVSEVERMVLDGHRLLQLEHACQNSYMCFVVALDWRRFEATSDEMLVKLTQDLLKRPAVQGFVTFLVPRWMFNSFHCYHEQLLEFRLGSIESQQSFVHENVRRCDGCSLFLQEDIYQQEFCVGCRRGGFICKGKPPKPIISPFWRSATEALHQAVSKCDRLVSILNGQAEGTAVTSIELPSENLVSEELLMLNVLSQMNQKLEDLCQRDLLACDACRQRKTRCSLKLARISTVQRHRRRIARLLPALTEADEVDVETNPSAPQ